MERRAKFAEDVEGRLDGERAVVVGFSSRREGSSS